MPARLCQIATATNAYVFCVAFHMQFFEKSKFFLPCKWKRTRSGISKKGGGADLPLFSYVMSRRNAFAMQLFNLDKKNGAFVKNTCKFTEFGEFLKIFSGQMVSFKMGVGKNKSLVILNIRIRAIL